MFLLLVRILLWILIGLGVYFLLVKIIPKQWLVILGGSIIFLGILIAFLNPSAQITTSFWTIFSLFFKPVGLSLLLLFLGARRIKKTAISNPGSALIWSSLIILLLSSTPFIAYQMAQGMELEAIQAEQQRREICAPNCVLQPIGQETAPVIVLLGQGTTEPNLPYRTQIQLTDKGNRIFYTAQVYEQQVNLGNNPFVIVSAAIRSNLEGAIFQRSEASDIGSLLEQFGVPNSQIILDSKGTNLRNSAVEVKSILQQRGIEQKKIILVTSGINMRRAKLTFNQLGIDVVSRPSDFYTFQSGAIPRRKLGVEDFIPSVEALVISTRVVEEYLGSLYYFLRGWLSPVVL